MIRPGEFSYKVKQRYDMVNYHARSVIPGQGRRLSPSITLDAQ